MAWNIFSRLGDELRRPWYELPRVPAIARLIAIRNQLRRENLYDTEEPPLALSSASMGCPHRRFGRNFPLDHTFPDTPRLMTPSPRIVSRDLMTRDVFRPATSLNLLAAAWIQFMVHDWFAHKRSDVAHGTEIPLAPDDDWPADSMRVATTVADASPSGSTHPPAYANENSHWWDASQVYGSDPVVAASLRAGEGGLLRLTHDQGLPLDGASGLHLSGFTDNWWVGLALLHTLFAREHNWLCGQLARQYPSWSDESLFNTAKRINTAVMARIHTVEWTPAILPHPVVAKAMHVNWHGLAPDELQELFTFIDESELLGGIVGSRQDHHGVAYALTEEFVAVYRMHPLIPDEVTFRAVRDDRLLEACELPEMAGRRTCGVCDRISMVDLLYSFGRSHPGAITLHNYPRHLQNLVRDNGEHFDLAAVDIFRDRERGVPRYNQFRRLVHKAPLTSIDELTDNAAWRSEIRHVYGNDLEAVDLMTGLFAEPLPEGFGFSETAFRIFVLMASRRLQSDRFFTDDYNAATYTELGLNHIRMTTMKSVLLRHHPELTASLEGVENAFGPWNIATPGNPTPEAV